MFACLHGHIDIVRLLLEKDASLVRDKNNDEGTTAFMFVCMEGHIDIVWLLIGKDPDQFLIRHESG